MPIMCRPYVGRAIPFTGGTCFSSRLDKLESSRCKTRRGGAARVLFVTFWNVELDILFMRCCGCVHDCCCYFDTC